MEKLTEKYNNTKDPAERAQLKGEMGKVPVTSGELEQVQQREADRQVAAVQAFEQKMNSR